MKYATQILDAVYAHLNEEVEYLRKWKDNATTVLDQISAEHNALADQVKGEPEEAEYGSPATAACHLLARLYRERDEARAEAERLRTVAEGGVVAFPAGRDTPDGYAEAVRNARRLAGDDR